MSDINYRAEVYYSYRRQKTCCGMTVQAADEDEAIEKANAKILEHYPAAKISATSIMEESRK